MHIYTIHINIKKTTFCTQNMCVCVQVLYNSHNKLGLFHSVALVSLSLSSIDSLSSMP
jgi:hypothetical protein